MQWNGMAYCETIRNLSARPWPYVFSRRWVLAASSSLQGSSRPEDTARERDYARSEFFTNGRIEALDYVKSSNPLMFL